MNSTNVNCSKLAAAALAAAAADDDDALVYWPVTQEEPKPLPISFPFCSHITFL